ncbi:MAG: CsbD family protein [Chloroflexota bacterium]|nr:CsbD family protein [Chloroflexota bacterium]
MTDEQRLRGEGKIDEVKGNVKSGIGRATGDERTEGEGKMDEMKGKVKQGAADAKDKIDDAMRNVTDC